jgi:hypothetical protein
VARRALPFAEASLARTFAEELLPLLRAELVFSLEGAAWARDGLRGHIFRLLGYRVHNRCSGEVLMASPVSKAEAGGLREPGTCPKPRAVVAQPKGPPAVDLPLRLSSAELQKVVGGRGQQMDACYERFQIAGLARIALEVAGDGSVRDIRVHGTFEGTPTAACLIEALRALSFPKFRSPSIKVEVPIILPR